MKVLDVTGLPCPEPLVRAKQALVDQGEAEVLLYVDSSVTRDNLLRFAQSKGFTYAQKEAGGRWEITLTHGSTGQTVGRAMPVAAPQNPPVILCLHATFGAPSGELGTLLIRAFFKTLPALEVLPGKIIFLNEGVNLLCFDEQVTESVRQMEQCGVDVLSCGTCLDYFHLLDKIRVGRVGNMYDIAGALLEAGHVVEI